MIELALAAKNGHANVCLELIEAGASTEAADSGDWTALIWVSYCYFNIRLNFTADCDYFFHFFV